MKRLSDRTVVITGAAGGIGRALAHAFARQGCHLALVDHSEDRLQTIARQIHTPAVRVSQHIADLRDLSALERLPSQIVDAHGEAHLLINNAGLTVHGSFDSQTAADIDQLLDVNLRAVIHGCRVFLPILREADTAHVVNVSSMAALVGLPLQSTYCASKAAIRAFTQSLRAEWSPLKIGATAVLPGTIATPFLSRATSYDPHTTRRMRDLMLRYGTSPERLANRIVRAVRRNQGEVLVGWDSHLTSCTHRLAPRLIPTLLGLAYRRFAPHGQLGGPGAQPDL